MVWLACAGHWESMSTLDEKIKKLVADINDCNTSLSRAPARMTGSLHSPKRRQRDTNSEEVQTSVRGDFSCTSTSALETPRSRSPHRKSRDSSPTHQSATSSCDVHLAVRHLLTAHAKTCMVWRNMLNRHMRAFGESVTTDQFTHTEMSLADGGGFVAHLVIPNRFASGDGVTLAVSSSNWAGKKKPTRRRVCWHWSSCYVASQNKSHYNLGISKTGTRRSGKFVQQPTAVSKKLPGLTHLMICGPAGF